MNKYDYYISTNSILYIDSSGQLKRLYCPFQVVARISIAAINKGDLVIVQAVKITADGKDVYIIDGKGYYVMFFRLT